MARVTQWKVMFGRWTYLIVARTAGGAARKAFRSAIRDGKMKRQPPTDCNTGGWKGVWIGHAP